MHNPSSEFPQGVARWRAELGDQEYRLFALIALSFIAIWIVELFTARQANLLLLYLIPPLLTVGTRQRWTILLAGTTSILATLTDCLLTLPAEEPAAWIIAAEFSIALQSIICYLALRQCRMLAVEQRLREQSDAELDEISGDLARLEHNRRRLERRNRELAALNEIASAISRAADLRLAFNYALEQVERLTAHEVVAVLRYDEQTQELTTFAQRGLTEEEIKRGGELRFDQSFSSRVILRGTPSIVEDFSADESVHPLLRSYGFVSHVALPIVDGEKRLGALILASRSRRRVSEEDLSFLGAVANQLAAAITRHQLARETEEQAARQLAFERRFTRLLAEHAPVAIAHLTTELRYVGANPIYLDLMRTQLGDAGLELTGRSLADVFPQVSLNRQWQVGIDQVLHRGQPFTLRAQPSYAPASGQTSYWDWTVWPVKDEEGEVESVLLLGAKVTERIHAERQLEAALADAWTERNKLEAMIEHITDAVFIAEAASKRIVRVNSAVMRLLGFEEPQQLEVGLEHYSSLISPQLPDGTLMKTEELLMTRALRGEQIYNAHMVWRRRDGQLIHVIAGASPIRNSSGEIVMAVVTAHEVTSLLQIQAELERSNQAKDLFLAMLSHELRTPLTPVLGWANILRDNLDDRAVVKRGLEAIERNTRLQAQLVDDLLDLSRIITGKIELVRAPVDLNQIVRHALETVQYRIDTQMLDLELDLALDPLPVNADATRLEQVIWNLLSNAVKFTPVRGRIRVSSRISGDYCQVEVSDNGIGIRPDLLPVIFNRFCQADSSTSRRHGGLGIGLAIARSLVEMHGGWIEADSKGEGRGARFTVAIPGHEAKLKRPARQKRRPGATARSLEDVRILILEDSTDTRELLGILLSAYGCQVSLASSVPEGLKLAAEIMPDVVLSDIGLPDLDGYEFVRRLRGLRGLERVPVIALTGYAMDGDRKRALESGFDKHLAKPVESEQLIIAIQQVLSKLET
jgi:PAS domain S-box-containing protein